MSISHGGAATPSLSYADRVRRVDADEPYEWLQAGWRDFAAAPAASLAYGLLFVVVGLALTLGLWRSQQLYMLAPLASGFMLLGPVLTTGFQAISRDLERGQRPSFGRALLAWRVNAGPIFYAALAFMLLFLLWLRLSELLFALSFPYPTGLDLQSLLTATFFTAEGLRFLALFLILGAAMAAAAFVGGAVALPMLIDQQVGMFEAVGASVTAVMTNLRAMALWAAMLVALVAVGMALFYVGLVVTLPIAGHAAWHAYRATIRPQA